VIPGILTIYFPGDPVLAHDTPISIGAFEDPLLKSVVKGATAGRNDPIVIDAYGDGQLTVIFRGLTKMAEGGTWHQGLLPRTVTLLPGIITRFRVWPEADFAAQSIHFQVPEPFVNAIGALDLDALIQHQIQKQLPGGATTP